MTLIPERQITSQDRILDYLAARNRARRRLFQIGWLFSLTSLAGAFYVTEGYRGIVSVAFALFCFFWFVYIIAASAVKFIHSEEQKRIVMEHFIINQGYRVDFDDLESHWVIRREM